MLGGTIQNGRSISLQVKTKIKGQNNEQDTSIQFK